MFESVCRARVQRVHEHIRTPVGAPLAQVRPARASVPRAEAARSPSAQARAAAPSVRESRAPPSAEGWAALAAAAAAELAVGVEEWGGGGVSSSIRFAGE